MNDFSRNVAFHTDSADYELLTDIAIKSAIKVRLGLTTDTEYDTLLKSGISNLGFCVFANTRLSINGEPYDYQEPIQSTVIGDGIINSKSLITSIKVEGKDIDGSFYFRIG